MVLLCSVAARGHVSFAQGQPNAVLTDGVAQLLLKIEAAVGAGSASDFLALSTLNPDDPNVRAFLDRWLVARTTRATVRERDRLPLDGGGVRLMAEALIEAGSEGRLATWTLEMAPAPDGTWRLTKATTSGIVDGLFHLELDPTRAFRAHDLVVLAEDFELRLPAGDVFVAMAGGRISAAVLMGRGTMTFRPTPDTERRQVELYCGREALTTQFNWAFLRLSPGEAETRLPAAQLTPSNVDKSMLSRAREVFAEQLPKSFGVELGDLSRLPWSLVPTPGDFLAEVDTGKYGTLTYANADNDQEDITVFDREHHRNIAVYMSAARRASQSQVYNEDDSTEYDVQDYQVDNAFIPERFWMEGRTTLKIRVRAYALSALTFKLAEPLFVQSVTSDQYGRLLALRVRGQSGVVLNLPTPAHRGDVLTLTVRYSGRLEPHGVDRENVGVQGSAAAQRDHARARARAQLRLQQPHRVVRAGPGVRLRDGHHPADGAVRLRRRVQRRARLRFARAVESRRRRRADAQAVRVHGADPSAVSRMRRRAVHSRRREGRLAGDGRLGGRRGGDAADPHAELRAPARARPATCSRARATSRLSTRR